MVILPKDVVAAGRIGGLPHASPRRAASGANVAAPLRKTVGLRGLLLTLQMLTIHSHCLTIAIAAGSHVNRARRRRDDGGREPVFAVRPIDSRT
ncbi:hypothetical protein [Burkholderia dolosa]|uniref:hypothetical protein n=1 Tax=Burkholderia dolosa TaxID=152500 RepID=UPI001591C729|nr:hypothetical protein [Burkholderia dolosa]